MTRTRRFYTIKRIKPQEWQKRMRFKKSHQTKNGYCCACEYDLAIFENKLAEAKQEFRKILNSGRKMYELGKKEK